MLYLIKAVRDFLEYTGKIMETTETTVYHKLQSADELSKLKLMPSYFTFPMLIW